MAETEEELYATSLEDAQKRASAWWKDDPYPTLQPTLLNRDEIAQYVAKVGLVYPFNQSKLKTASYQVPFSGTYLYWDADGEERYCEPKDPTKGSLVKLRPNSITYVGVDAYFCIPHYLALRFNLSITHVHRGLLLGTGPLIDPAFRGRIMIPLHNLTNNEYSLRPNDLNEDLIAIEFTKLRAPENPSELNIKPTRTFREFVDDALKATDENAVSSSVGKIINDANASFKEASNTYEQAKKSYQRVQIWAAVVGGLAVVGLVIAMSTFLLSAYSHMDGLRENLEHRISDLESQAKNSARSVRNLPTDIETGPKENEVLNVVLPTDSNEEDYLNSNTGEEPEA